MCWRYKALYGRQCASTAIIHPNGLVYTCQSYLLYHGMYDVTK
jgi:hypothetical protein